MFLESLFFLERGFKLLAEELRIVNQVGAKRQQMELLPVRVVDKNLDPDVELRLVEERQFIQTLQKWLQIVAMTIDYVNRLSLLYLE